MKFKLTRKNIKEFKLEKIHLLGYECIECGYWISEKEKIIKESPEKIPNKCPDCKEVGSFYDYTQHEDTNCAVCYGHISMWHDCYTMYDKNLHDDVFVCKDCIERFNKSLIEKSEEK